jgi:small GTP-binding protein
MTDFKISFIGSSKAGKTSIFNTLFDKRVNNISPSIGPTAQTKTFHLGKNEIKIKFIDTSESGRFRHISRGYFKNSDAILLVFDLTNRKTFQDLTKWMEEIRMSCDSETFVLLIGNKKDLKEKRQVSKTEAEQFASKFDLKYEEVCSFHKKEMKTIIQEFIAMIVKPIYPGTLHKGNCHFISSLF